MAELKKTTEQARTSCFRRWIYGNLTCFTQEHMQTFGYLYAMLPVIDELYDKDEDRVEALKTYTAFFNSEPQIASMVVGLTVGLEEARANGEPMDAETINGIRAGLMGPLAGLGDSIIVGTFIPILLGIAMGLSQGGNPLGPIFYIVAWNVLMYFLMKTAFDRGYSMGGAAVEALVGPQSAALRAAIGTVGTMVIGAVAGTWVSISTSFTVQFSADSAFSLQSTLDNIMPKALNLVFVYLCWWLMTKKKISPTIVMLILVLIAFLGSITIPGINTSLFDPGLSY